MHSPIKAPLAVYILWHQDFEAGYLYAKEIYTHFTRDILDPASRGIGIPVLFPSEYKGFEHKLKINFDKTERVAIVLFIEEKMLLDAEWHLYIKQLQDRCDKDSKYIIYPVALSKSSYKLPVDSVKSKNYIRLFEKNSTDKFKYLIFILAHELCRFLYGIERISEIENNQSPPPVKLFLSHAKVDGLKITKSIWEYIKLDTPLDDFFDAQDIAPGYDFASEIKASIPNCMLLVIHTDKYSSRDWCRKEILLSKEFSIPILVLDCLDRHESRSFPYMANVQTLRIKENEGTYYQEILSVALKEVLRYLYQSLHIRFVLDSCNLHISTKNILCYPPELFSLVRTIDKNEKIIVYPDPPLSSQELALLRQYRSDFQFSTPTILPCIDPKARVICERPFNSFKIGISISETLEDNAIGLNILHLQDLMVEIARYLLAGGAQLYYGGDILYQDFNFLNILACLVENHNEEHETVKQKIINFVPNYLRKSVSESIQTDLIDVAKFHFMEPIDSLDYENSNDTLYTRYLKARDLSNMRVQMNKNINARIILGGKKQGYQGIYPGLLEELMLAIISEKPVFLIGAYGGIVKEIIKCITGEESEVLSKEYQSSHNDYGDFCVYYNQLAIKNGLEVIDYESVKLILKSKGISGLNNGLTKDENINLFQSSNTVEIISLILKGLSSKFFNVTKIENI